MGINIQLNDTATYHTLTYHPTSGLLANADSTPTWEIFENETSTAITSGNLVNYGTGQYYAQVECTSVNGFEVGKFYNLIIAATVAGVTAKKVLDTIRIDEAVFHADCFFTRDNTNSRDEYTICWYKNGVSLTTGITSPQIQVIKRADGTNLIAATAMTQIGSIGAYKYDEASNRMTMGEAALVVATATIEGAVRTWRIVIGRDG